MKALVLGGEGMLGHKMFQTLSGYYPDTTCTLFGSLSEPPCASLDLFRAGNVVERVDAMDLPALEARLRALRPDFLVNCIGVIKQRREASSAIPSITLNALLPHALARMARQWGGRVVHFSTDCVFSGRRGRYTEEDPSDAEDLYGKTKFLGEVAEENALTLRTSIIGRELTQFKSLLEWFLAQEGKVVRGFTGVIYSGVTTNYLADLVARLLSEHPDLSGLYQVTAPPISKYELLCRLKSAYGTRVEIIADEKESSDRSMLGEKFLSATGYGQPAWDSLVGQLVSDPTPYSKWRGRSGDV
jgi:dTDP-4-dehydrorhamnose reductase